MLLLREESCVDANSRARVGRLSSDEHVDRHAHLPVQPVAGDAAGDVGVDESGADGVEDILRPESGQSKSRLQKSQLRSSA